eukprot:gb/GECG01004089.1/.p1 GENE.gb/GECG01004089.1/~~gb/GECG01004089.1/.p1  ORF type:complete len:421 (+),score=31.58 gb/GECG01004089.1/:1-1263(+)
MLPSRQTRSRAGVYAVPIFLLTLLCPQLYAQARSMLQSADGNTNSAAATASVTPVPGRQTEKGEATVSGAQVYSYCPLPGGTAFGSVDYITEGLVDRGQADWLLLGILGIAPKTSGQYMFSPKKACTNAPINVTCSSCPRDTTLGHSADTLKMHTGGTYLAGAANATEADDGRVLLMMMTTFPNRTSIDLSPVSPPYPKGADFCTVTSVKLFGVSSSPLVAIDCGGHNLVIAVVDQWEHPGIIKTLKSFNVAKEFDMKSIGLSTSPDQQSLLVVDQEGLDGGASKAFACNATGPSALSCSSPFQFNSPHFFKEVYDLVWLDGDFVVVFGQYLDRNKQGPALVDLRLGAEKTKGVEANLQEFSQSFTHGYPTTGFVSIPHTDEYAPSNKSWNFNMLFTFVDYENDAGSIYQYYVKEFRLSD